MLEIPLTQGQIALIDEIDGGRVHAHKWCASRHPDGSYRARTYIEGVGVSMPRFLLGLVRYDKHQVDHINHNTLDNRRSNLRICTPSQNCRNRRTRGGSSRYRGVIKDGDNWRVNICLGQYDTEELAARAYDRAARLFHDGFGRLNFPEDSV